MNFIRNTFSTEVVKVWEEGQVGYKRIEGLGAEGEGRGKGAAPF